MYQVLCRKQSLASDAFSHKLRTPNEAFIHQNPNFLGLGRQIWQLSFGAYRGICSQFISTHSGTVSTLFMFFIARNFILQGPLL